MKIAVYPGSFDPISNGHLDIIKRASKLFDKVYILVANNITKKYTFSNEERVNMIKKVVSDIDNIEIVLDDGLVVDYAKKVNANVIIRGLRNQNDFQDELTLFSFNRTIQKDIETILLFASPDNLFLSSSAIKELVMFDCDISSYVPLCIKDEIINKIKSVNK